MASLGPIGQELRSLGDGVAVLARANRVPRCHPRKAGRYLRGASSLREGSATRLRSPFHASPPREPSVITRSSSTPSTRCQDLIRAADQLGRESGGSGADGTENEVETEQASTEVRPYRSTCRATVCPQNRRNPRCRLERKAQEISRLPASAVFQAEGHGGSGFLGDLGPGPVASVRMILHRSSP